jgi:hypothetical protein
MAGQPHSKPPDTQQPNTQESCHSLAPNEIFIGLGAVEDQMRRRWRDHCTGNILWVHFGLFKEVNFFIKCLIGDEAPHLWI